MIEWFFQDGRLTGKGTILLGILGFGLIAYTLLLAESRFLGIASFVLGCGMLIFAGISNNAASLGQRPFATDPLGWRKAKKSYESREPSSPSDESEKQ